MSSKLKTPTKKDVESPTTSRNLNQRVGDATFSPASKRSLDFDFWGEREVKVKKVDADDLRNMEISELVSKGVNDGILVLKCTCVFDRSDQSKLMKYLFEDNSNAITLTAFGIQADKLKGLVKVGFWYSIYGFDVRSVNPNYKSGTYKDLELFYTDKTKVKLVDKKEEIRRHYELHSIEEIDEIADDTIIDFLGVIVMEWELRKTKIDLSLTDMSKKTIRLTVWGDDAEKLLGSENQLLGLKRCVVSSFQGIKCLNTKWFTCFELNPPGEDTEALANWFAEEVNRK